MRTSLGLRMRITVALAVTAAATALFAVLGAMWIIAGIIDRADQRELRSHYDALQSRIAEESHRAAAMSAVVAAMPATQEAMAKQDREALVRLFGPVFTAIKSDYGVDQFQFHVPPATSYLRVHQPAKFGDDLSGFRKTVVVANQDRKVVVGLEGGVAGLGIRGVVPIAQGTKHLGTVEFGLTFGQPFLDDFKTNRHVDIAFHLADGSGFKLFGGTLKGKSFFDTADYGRAAEGGFTVRQARLDTTPVAALLGPIRDFSGKPLGAVELVMDNADYEASADRAWLLAIGIAALGLVLAAIVGYLIARSISRPILSITNVMRELADGRLDVAVPTSKANDEVGAMVKAVAVFRDNAVNFDKLQAEQLEAKAQSEAEKRRAFAALADNFEASIREVVTTVSAAAVEMEHTARSMSAIVEQSREQTRTVSSASALASENVQTVAAAAEELSSSMTEISRRLAHATEVVGKAASDGRQSNARVQSLADAAQKIGDVVSFINGIAGQTNLLALNATIEAARAGEAGRGFAVVASEVKALATQTAKATEEIGAQVTAVQGETTGAVDGIQSICATIQQVDEISAAIAAAVGQQGTATQEIAQNVQQAAARTGEVSQNISGVTAGIAATGTAAEEVLGSAIELSKQSQRLRDEVDRFLAHIRAA
ncbi:methyl-accepting chemotaxis protein [Bradyrhizobium diazoefficiens]|uniref:Putative methyl accepting chemotaxis protein n=1 Tax=Bradyrhizobium diazoefficiens TaxID=1355477 RepID=A0A0E4FWH6_9BRAD|nr:methyl-accepting chemotaxis protein [Bradyrhizobium diazoefficiens]MBR0863094.1 HAMP domain-containing protein [Bradyrhizobium diazoefficiens]MBR0887658.1 HAMP domain-containing protein [Bradyrhizobium diazoefficiens]MBR0919481.1 HAMP domain-containing protein [Bradyrhizobium diazoefficiens]BAR58224.1 putative methyl accepting chemotaxis protein [Bradyrhizobium diazoefficiens]